MPSYAGIDLGLVMEPTDGPAPVEFQRNAYPGVNGIEQLIMGSRGWVYTLQVFLPAASLVGFSALKSALYTYAAAGSPNTYVDAEGFAHGGVVLQAIRPSGPRYNIDAFGGVGQRFSMEFFYPGA